MTIGIQWGDASSDWSGLIYLDAVTSYTRNHSGQVTKHPVDGGGNITDHFIRENDKITLSAVISGVDISTNVFNLYDEDGNSAYNWKYDSQPVSVSSSDNSLINKLIPASLTQFVGSSKPDVTLAPQNPDHTLEIQGLLEELVYGERYDKKTDRIEPFIQIVNLYEFSGSDIFKIKRNYVITSVNFNETVESGDGLYCEISLEAVKFATLETSEIPSDVKAEYKAKSAEKSSKGKQDSTAKDPEDPKNTDPSKKKSVAAQAVDGGTDFIKTLTGG